MLTELDIRYLFQKLSDKITNIPVTKISDVSEPEVK